MLWIFVFSIIPLLLAFFYWLSIRPYKYWIERNVPQGNPVPILGDNWTTFFQKMSYAEMVLHIYNMCPGTKVSGMYQMSIPTLILKDPEIIKQITVRDFDHFMDHRSFIPTDSYPLWSNNLFASKGQRWRELRSALSPAFTPSKMKFMFGLINDIALQFTDHFLKQSSSSEMITIELKDKFARFTNDVIASTAFGVECDSLNEPKNEFYMIGRDVTNFSGLWKNFKFFSFFLLPKLCELLNLRVFSENATDFFLSLIKENITSRNKHGIVRPDLVHLMMKARKDNALRRETENQSECGVEFTDVEITAQSLMFFFAAIDSVSALLCFTAYELGIHPEIQDQLRGEIHDAYAKCDGKLTYETISDMKYIDMVISESLRKWPNGATTDRVCIKPYTLDTPEFGPLKIDSGTVVWLPIFAIHRDPKFFPDPERFDPERFSDENKGNIHPYTYLPFGSGPRNCIGARMALLEAKVFFFYLLYNFEIVPTEKTSIPLKLSKRGFNLNSANGFWFHLKRI